MAEPMDGYGIHVMVRVDAEPFYRHGYQSVAVNAYSHFPADDLKQVDLPKRHKRAKAAAERFIADIKDIYYVRQHEKE